METLLKQPQGIVVVDVDDEEQQGNNQTGNEEQEDRTCFPSSSSSSHSCSSPDMDLESGLAETETNPHLDKEMEIDCRICHLTLDPNNHESGVPIELGCSCKDDLAAAHKHCAETWFKIKGNRTCEICGSTAWNVVVVATATESGSTETWNEANDFAAATAPVAIHGAETRNFWQGHRFLNFLLACMVFAFVISWLFHFNVPS